MTQTQRHEEVAPSSRILLVEDEALIGSSLGEALEEEGYSVVKTTSGQMGETFIQSVEQSVKWLTFDLMILNLMRPQLNGLDLCRLVRSAGNPVPIMIVSAQASVTDIVLGLEMGADDYRAFPFGRRELVARIRALLRRQRLSFLTPSGNLSKVGQPSSHHSDVSTPNSQGKEGYPTLDNRVVTPTPMLQWRDATVYPQECRVVVRGQEIHFPPQEFRLLVLLMSSPNQVWSREQLLDLVWGASKVGQTKTLEVHIHRLREKLELDPKKPEYIITVSGIGYRLG